MKLLTKRGWEIHWFETSRDLTIANRSRTVMVGIQDLSDSDLLKLASNIVAIIKTKRAAVDQVMESINALSPHQRPTNTPLGRRTGSYAAD